MQPNIIFQISPWHMVRRERSVRKPLIRKAHRYIWHIRPVVLFVNLHTSTSGHIYFPWDTDVKEL